MIQPIYYNAIVQILLPAKYSLYLKPLTKTDSGSNILMVFKYEKLVRKNGYRLS